MKAYISQDMAAFLTPKPGEEMLDQPQYDIQTYPQAGTTKLSFFGTAVASAANGLADTNMDNASQLSAGKRFAVFSIGIAVFAGIDPVSSQAGVQAYINELKTILEAPSFLKFDVLDKNYLKEAPLTRVPGAQGLWSGGSSLQNFGTAGANERAVASHATNGTPDVACRRYLRVPIPIPQQTRFEVSLNWTTATAITAAARIGVWLDGSLIRAKQ